MTDVVPPLRDAGSHLSAALKLTRVRRSLTVAQIAEAMHIAPRTYQRFEAGRARLNLDHIQRFAQATDSDFGAILMAVALRSPELAWRAADVPLVSVFTVMLERFNTAYGDHIRELDVRTVVEAMTEMFDTLGLAADASRDARRWLQDPSPDPKRPLRPPQTPKA